MFFMMVLQISIVIVFGLYFSILLLLKRRKLYILQLLKYVLVSTNIALLILLSLIYGFRTFMKKPVAPSFEVVWKLEDKLKKWERKGAHEKIASLKEQIVVARKEFDEKEAQYKKDMEKYIKMRLILASIIGVAILILGAFIAEASLGAGLIVGGILCITNGVSFYWYEWSDVIRFLIIIGSIFLLLIIGFWFLWRTRRKI